MKNRNRLLLLISVLLVSISGCKSRKKTVGMDNLEAASLVDRFTIANAFPEFLQARGKASYRADGTKQSFRLEIRMQRDSLLWLDVADPLLGMKVARALLREDSIFFYTRFPDKEYLAESMEKVNKLLGFRVPFSDLQRFLAGYPLALPDKKSKLGQKEGMYTFLTWMSSHMLPRSAEMHFDEKNYLLAYQSLAEHSSQLKIEARYNDFQRMDDYYARASHLITVSGAQDMQLDIQYDRISTDSIRDFPFTIPKGYTLIK